MNEKVFEYHFYRILHNDQPLDNKGENKSFSLKKKKRVETTENKGENLK